MRPKDRGFAEIGAVNRGTVCGSTPSGRIANQGLFCQAKRLPALTRIPPPGRAPASALFFLKLPL